MHVPLLHRQREQRVRCRGPDGAHQAHGELTQAVRRAERRTVRRRRGDVDEYGA